MRAKQPEAPFLNSEGEPCTGIHRSLSEAELDGSNHDAKLSESSLSLPGLLFKAFHFGLQAPCDERMMAEISKAREGHFRQQIWRVF